MAKKHFRTLGLLTLALVVLLVGAPRVHALTLTPTRFEISGDPGQTLTQEMTLINERDTAETYYSTYMNFEAQGETGSPTFVNADEDLGTWMAAPAEVFLAPGQSKIVPVTITIPSNADAGGHFAAVFWGTQSPEEEGNGVSVGSKTGVLVLLRVNGDVSEDGGIVEFSTKGAQKFYTSRPVNFFYRFQNSGGDRIKPVGDVVIKNTIGVTSATVPGNPVEGNILPSSTRKFETVWQGKDGAVPKTAEEQGNFFNKVGYEWRNFAFGYYNAQLTLSFGTDNQVSTAATSFWVFPWHLTVTVIVGLILIFFIGRKLIRAYNRWVIRKAEEAIKKEQSGNPQ